MTDLSGGAWRALVERNADGVLIVDAQGRVRYANPAAGRLFGRASGSLVGQELGFPLVAAEAVEVILVRGGVPVYAELRAAPIEWDGEPAHLVSLRDTTDRRRAEEQRRARERAEAAAQRAAFLAEIGRSLAQSLAHARTALSAAADRVGSWLGGRGRVLLLEADGRGTLLPDGTPLPPAALAPLRAAVESGQATRLEHAEAIARALDLPAGRALLAAPLRVRGRVLGALLLAVAPTRPIDVDTLLLVEEVAERMGWAWENARLYEAAHAANEAKTNFLAVMSHELRTPLNAIVGYAELLLEGLAGPLTEQQRDFLERLRTSAHHLQQMVDEILTFARLDAHREEVIPRATHLGPLAAEAAQVIAPLAGAKGLAFVQEVSAPDTELETDPAKVRQILLNLLSNAVKFTPEGGRVRLAAGREGERVWFRVEDTGIGIAPEDLGRIWDPFWQADQGRTRVVTGTGLGLSVAKDLAELLGGELRVRSRLGEGSVFELWLPRRWPGPRRGASVEDASA